jgi:hypothetical protein
MDSSPQSALLQLLTYCRSNDWAGYDPYDGLNSRLFERSPLANSKLARLVLTQALKRSPINIRALLMVPKVQNPKGVALLLSALSKMPWLCPTEINTTVDSLIERLVALRSPATPYWCWGYSFPWQTRSKLIPRGAANLVSTVFAANALLDMDEYRGQPEYLDMAVSAATYLAKELYWTENSTAGFSYPYPSARNQIHNANFLAAALLCRIYKRTGDESMLDQALTTARCSVARQKPDGSWPYGEEPSQQWIDNFHTGYNLCALQSIAVNTGTSEFDAVIRRGVEFYQRHFILRDGVVRYFHNRTYPVDIHCVAQSILTLLAFKGDYPDNVKVARSVCQWALDHMWDERGFFYYRALRFGTIRTSYMRWSQAWMLLALAELVAATGSPNEKDTIMAANTAVTLC